ncbi:hypothetical protein TWF481_003831 [Arthrobotrys musiformis]|uniref:Glutaredoxin-like protein n=1 Tax=Arthrobotrys musiformis TaxID=47236 RepID=A0AAV9WNI8_9PEZI
MPPKIPWNLLRLTFFTNKNCSLCSTAVVNTASWRLKETNNMAEFKEVDIFGPGNEKWHDAYVFDVPVVSSQNTNIYGSKTPTGYWRHFIYLFGT